MPDFKPNPIVRAVAVIALVAAFFLVVVVIATSGGGSDSKSGDSTVENSGPSRRGQSALEKGVWIVRSGDTLLRISDATGIDVDELIQLNADLDPQALIEGQRIALR